MMLVEKCNHTGDKVSWCMLRYTSILLITHGYVYCYTCIVYDKEMLVSDDKNHIKVH